MTTLRDYLNDLIVETQERLQSYADKDRYPELSNDEREELLDEYIENIKKRMIG